MHRLLLVGAALCGLASCVPPPGSPSLLQTPVTGNWTGTFESNWGAIPVTATLANEKYSQTISGSFALGGKRATGTIYGALETHAKDDPGMFYGTLTISYRLSSGDVCRGTSDVTIGSAFETSFSLVTSGFPTGNCSDPPSDVRMMLRR
jgi:hypothetical protein